MMPFEATVEEKPGDRIGRYKLLQKIGEGGCGVVYMAEQEEAVRRRVALKVIKLGMDTKAVIARFEAERQALARMEHPNIARVLDAGATTAGRPFFVMELVRGLRITEYCDQNNLCTEQRLDLFIRVCQAIQHAHQKGVIHRDIKPSNILVTLHDGQPVPKVIDFGIAKATQGRLTEVTLFTAFEQFIGTPAYVSPEQAEMSGLDIDTRSDIYSLGVLLYELLAGRTPFDTQELVAAGIDEMRRRIREQQPPRPSHRLRTLSDVDRTTVAKRRGTDAPRLTLRLRGDLDWIVMRCLEKDRARRYDTANGIAMDLERHLKNEPVSARPPSTAYLLQKLVRRHVVGVLATLAITLTLAVGFTVSTVLFFRERRTLERAREAEATALAEKTRAEVATANEARLRAEAEAGQAYAKRSAQLSASMAFTMKDIGLLFALGNDPRAQREFLEQTARRKKELDAQPDVEAGVDETLAGAYFKMGEFKRAEELFREALGLRQRAHGQIAPEVAQVFNYLGIVCSAQSRWEEAEKHHKNALEIYQDADRESADIARTQSAIGTALAQQADLSEAELHLRLALGQQRKLPGVPQRDIAATLTRLGSVLLQVDRLAESEELLKEALAINENAFGRQSLEVASSLNFLAITVVLNPTNQARVAEGIALYRQALEIRQRLNQPNVGVAPGEEPANAARPASLETILTQRAELTEIGAALRDTQLFATTQFGRDSWEEAFYYALRIWFMLQEGKFKEAEPLARLCLTTRSKLRPNDWSTHHVRHLLGAALAGQKHYAEAEPLLVEGYRGIKDNVASIPKFHIARLGESAQRVIVFYATLGRTKEVAEWREEFESLDPEAKKVLFLVPPR